MLAVLELKDFAIIDEVRLELSPGLNVLTGETGAGKSILVDALSLLIGGRADSSLVRSGSQSALIQGIFATTGQVSGIESASRRLQSSGRSTARIDGELVNIAELAQVGSKLIAIHGQHASQTLLDAASQRQLLDRLLDSKARAILSSYQQNFKEHQTISKELAALSEASRERARRLDVLQFQIDEISEASLESGEEEQLKDEVESLRHAERIVKSVGAALSLLSEDDVNATDLLAEANQQLSGVSRYNATLELLLNELNDTLTGLQATVAELANFLADFEAEPGRLETIEQRLALIDRLKLKYGDSISAILSYQNQAAKELEMLAQADDKLSDLEWRQATLDKTLHTQAQNISETRQKAAATLATEVSKQLRQLGMNKAKFEIELNQLPQLSSSGQDKVEFMFTANLGEALAPLSAVASGGELSRVMLGLNVVTGSDLATLIFDEVDAGIGGKTAKAVGQLLKTLAKEHQVLVVTHLAQVAAFADAQFYVQKIETKGRTITRVNRLEPHERELELARMLSGAATEAALAHARELLQEAQPA